MTSAQFEYIIFDMDGLLIDSTQRTFGKATNDMLAPYGKELTWDIKAELMGKPERDSAARLLSIFPDIPLSVDDYLRRRQVILDELWPTVQPLPGVLQLVRHLHAHHVPMAVATSSTRRNFELKTSHLQELFELFEDKIVCSDDLGYKMKGKPNPDIFLTAARDKLGRLVGGNQVECGELEKEERGKGLVFEDAILGMQAGKRAGMSVVWVPDPHLLEVEYSGKEIADQIITSIKDFVPEQWGLPSY